MVNNGYINRLDGLKEMIARDSDEGWQQARVRDGKRCLDGNGVDYRGGVATTVDGVACRPWNELKQRNPFHPSKPKNISKDLRSNFCRNPDNDPRGPWCFVQTRNRVRYQYCNVRPCNKRTPDLHPNAYRPLPQLENLLTTVNLNTPVRNS